MRNCLPFRKSSSSMIWVICMRQRLITLLLLFILFPFSSALSQLKTVTGRVMSGDSAVAFATVMVKGTNSATQTDENGMFTLQATPNATLVVSSVGYTSQDIRLNNRSSVNVNLVSTLEEMEQVVVVGYGTQKKATLTGSVTSVKGAELLQSPTTNVSNSLAGRLPGLVTVTPSGEPGADGSILRIRGVNTLNNNNPLIVVDGIPGRSLERIDPSTIESITVLKDASAAIYGAQAANGVILITTKRGKSGKPTLTATFNQGYGRPTRVPDMADAATYATMLNEINMYNGVAPKYKPEEIQKYRDGSDPWRFPNTDWFNEVLRPWSGQNYANLSLNGGSESVRYFVSLSRRTQEGYYFNSGTRFDQYDFRTNLDGTINQNISIGFDVAGRMEDRNYPTRSAGSIFRMVMRGKPNEIAYWPNGLPGPDIEYGDNPVVVSTKATGYDRSKWYVLNTNGRLNIKIPWVPGLSFTGNAAIDKSFNFRKIWQTPWYLYSWNGTSVDANGIPVLERAQKGFSSPALNESMQDNVNVLLNGLLNYETDIFSDHGLKVLVGIERINGRGDNFSAYRRNFLSGTLDQLFAGATDAFMSNTGSAYSEGRLNYFGRVNYDYKEKFLAEFVWRYQGSYIFAEETRFGFFPGISVGYKISEEDFWRNNIPQVNSLKLRGSWGRTGNDQIDPFQYLSTYGFGGIRPQSYNQPLPFITNGSQENATLYETLLPNTRVTWEIANQANVGFDASFMNNRFSITADYFYYKRSQILWPRNASVPTSAGLQGLLPRENIGEVANRGFDFGMNYNTSAGEFYFEIGLNGGYQKNKILFWDETPGAPEYQRSTGRPINSGLYYKAIGVFRDSASISKIPHMSNARPGDIIFEDVNGDGKIDANDRIRIEKSDIPKFTGGLMLNIRYKGFDFAALVQGAAGAVRYISTESGEIGNFLQSFAENRWTPQNPDAPGPRTFNRSNEYWMSNANTYFLYKTDYVRLKNIELGYTLPAGVLRAISIQNARVYLNAFNLLTYSPDFKDFDPEMGTNSGQGYPLQKIINGGFSITF